MDLIKVIHASLSDLIALPDPEAASALSFRMETWDKLQRLQEVSYIERGVIVSEFERRQLWRFLVDPDTGLEFPNFTSWMSCSTFLGSRRINFESKRDLERLADVPRDQLMSVPKSNVKTLIMLSTAVRNDPEVLLAAKTMRREQFLSKMEKDHPDQHLEGPEVMRFSPGRSWAKTIERAIAMLIEKGDAGSRDEALLRMAEVTIEQMELTAELEAMK